MSNEHANPNETTDALTEEAADAPSAASVETAVAESTEMIPAEGDEGSSTDRTSVDMTATAIDIGEARRALEAVLLAASEPMPLNELRKIFDNELSIDIIRNLLDELRAEWADRSVELAVVASGYRFRVKPDYQKYLDRLSNDKPPKYSRAVLETLAIIAYRQPVTRGDIEDIRGVAVSPHILKTLEDRGWIDEIGHKEAPGRPVLFATTKHFLDDLNLRSLEELPPLHELQATLDMSAAGAALSAGVETPSLPGVAEAGQEEAPENVTAVDEIENETVHPVDAETSEMADETNTDAAPDGESADAAAAQPDADHPVADGEVK